MIVHEGLDYHYFDTFMGKKRADAIAKLLREKGYKTIVRNMEKEETVWNIYCNPAINLSKGKTIAPTSLVLTRKYIES
jgi:hypothetical protein